MPAGVPVIRGATRVDVARATGYAHAQDRLFQMDLLRRTGAGELAALLGAGLLDADRRHPHAPVQAARARRRSRRSPTASAALLDAYAAGVNAALAIARCAALRVLAPVGQSPSPWRAEDSPARRPCDVDRPAGPRRRGRAAARPPRRGTAGAPSIACWSSPDPRCEAPLDGSRLAAGADAAAGAVRPAHARSRALFERARCARLARSRDRAKVGSNNWAVAGSPQRQTAARWLANDMHLGLRVPNIWYRARLVVTVEEASTSPASRCPGLPADHCRQQRPRGLGVHQQLRRLPGPRARSSRAPEVGRPT